MRIPTPVCAAALGAILTLTLAACSEESLAPSGPLFSHSASENTGTFDWFFGSEFPLFAAGPAVSRAKKDGSRIEISGTGSFSIGEGKKSVSGGGTFEIFDSSDNLVASGNWTMERLRGFVDYGGFPPPNDDLRGGTLEAEIQLDGLGKGSLWIVCLIGNPPPSKVEGEIVKVGPWHFDGIDPAGGPNLFIRT